MPRINFIPPPIDFSSDRGQQIMAPIMANAMQLADTFAVKIPELRMQQDAAATNENRYQTGLQMQRGEQEAAAAHRKAQMAQSDRHFAGNLKMEQDRLALDRERWLGKPSASVENAGTPLQFDPANAVPETPVADAEPDPAQEDYRRKSVVFADDLKRYEDQIAKFKQEILSKTRSGVWGPAQDQTLAAMTRGIKRPTPPEQYVPRRDPTAADIDRAQNPGFYAENIPSMTMPATEPAPEAVAPAAVNGQAVEAGQPPAAIVPDTVLVDRVKQQIQLVTDEIVAGRNVEANRERLAKLISSTAGMPPDLRNAVGAYAAPPAGPHGVWSTNPPEPIPQPAPELPPLTMPTITDNEARQAFVRQAATPRRPLYGVTPYNQ